MSVRLDLQVPGNRVDQADRKVDERALGLELGGDERVDLLEVASPPVRVLEGSQMFLLPARIRVRDLEVARFALDAVGSVTGIVRYAAPFAVFTRLRFVIV